MDAIRTLRDYFIPAEAVLESVALLNLKDAVLTIKISDWNFTRAFFAKWGIPEDHDAAFAAINNALPGARLIIECKNLARIEIDRLGRHGNPEMILDGGLLSDTDEVEDSRKTIYGFSFGVPDSVEQLGDYASRFTQLHIDLVDARVTIVFEELALPNFPVEPRD